MGGMSYFMMVVLFAGGGKLELLDILATDAYWQGRQVTVSTETMLKQLKGEPAGDISALTKDLGSEKFEVREVAQKKIIEMGPSVLPQVKALLESKDAEVANRARQIVEQISSGGQAAPAVARLMAIRALGELKSKEALPALEALLTSKEPFVAGYARRAIAQINGKPYEMPKVEPKAMQEDLYLLPANCGMVAQMTGVPDKPLTLAKALEGFELPASANREEALAEVNKQLARAAHLVGNLRLDGVTAGVTDDMDGRTGVIVIIARGLYDRQSVMSALAEVGKRQTEKLEGIDVISPDRDGSLLLPSNDRFVVVTGPKMQKGNVEDLAKALKAGKGGLADNAEMVKFIKGLDTTGPLWAAVKVSEAYRKAPVLAPFDTLTLSTRQKDDTVVFSLTAQGKDADAVTKAVTLFKDGLAQARQGIESQAQKMPRLKPYVDFLGGIKITSDGGKATATGELKGTFSPAMFPLFFMFRSVERPMPPAAAPAVQVEVKRVAPER